MRPSGVGPAPEKSATRSSRGMVDAGNDSASEMVIDGTTAPAAAESLHRARQIILATSCDAISL